MSADHTRFLRRALALAARGRGRVSPNPPVGAVAVRNGVIVGEGWHRRFGGPHAEVDCIGHAGEACRGADLYVTLEPCGHHGKTPPCADAVIEAGFRRVFFGCADPNPVTAGRGATRLAEAGVEVVEGVEEAAARALIAPYLSLVHRRRPLVTAKWAMTADGRIATVTGDSAWISSETTRRRTLAARGSIDAILVGIGTALADDPLLTARTRGRPDPLRVVLDSTLRLPVTSRLVATARETPLLVIASAGRGGEPGFVDRRAALSELGADVIEVAPSAARAVDGTDSGRVAVPGVLDTLGARGVADLLVEGGAAVLGSFLDLGAVDRVRVVVAPKLVGGAEAPGPVGGAGRERMADALAVEGLSWRSSGPDRILEGSLTAAGRGEWSDPPPR